MADKLDSAQMRAAVIKVLESIWADIRKLNVRAFRGDLERHLGLAPLSLDSKKDEVQKLLTEELQRMFKERGKPDAEKPPSDKPSSDKPEESASKKQKKEKDKPDKNARKDAASSDDTKGSAEVVSAQPALSPAQTSSSAAAPPVVQPSQSEALAAELAQAFSEGPVVEQGDAKAVAEPEAPAEPPTEVAKEVTVQAAAALRPTISGLALSGAEDGQLRLWDLGSGACNRSFEGHVGTILTLAVSWEEMQAVSGAEDGARLWDLRLGGCQKSYACSGGSGAGCTAVAADWGADPKVLAGCGDGRLRLWGMRSGDLQKEVPAHPGGVWALEVNWKKQQAVSGGDELLKIWDMSDWSCKIKIDGHPGGITCLVVDWDDHRSLVGGGESSLRLWDTADRMSKSLAGHRDVVSSICANWAKKVALTAGWDAQLRLWNIERCLSRGHVDVKFGRIRSLAADLVKMQAVCGSSNGSLHCLDLRSGEQLRLLEGHIGAVTALQVRF